MSTLQRNRKQCVVNGTRTSGEVGHVKLSKANLPNVFESLPDFAAAALKTMKQKHQIRSTLEIDKEAQFLTNEYNLIMMIFPNIKRKDAVFAESSFMLFGSSRIRINGALTRGLISLVAVASRQRKGLFEGPYNTTVA